MHNGNHRRVGRRFTKYDVENMRQWARREGYGLSLHSQAKFLAAEWGCSVVTTREILANETWYDATYDRTTRLIEPSVPSTGYVAAWTAILRFLFGEVTCSRSH